MSGIRNNVREGDEFDECVFFSQAAICQILLDSLSDGV